MFCLQRGSINIDRTSRDFPPKGYGIAAPSTVINCVRKKFSATSFSCCSGRVLLLRPI